MELRQVKTDDVRRIFAQRMNEARAGRGVGFNETPESLLGRVHLAFAQLYALYEQPGEPPERMLSGFAMHNLASFPQSHPKPDLTYLPARSVLECGELWSFAKGAGLLARRGAALIAGLLQAKAILVYPVSKPWDGTASYVDFAKVGEPVDWPYGQTLDGAPLQVQPMVLGGEALERLVARAFALGFETCDGNSCVRFDNPFPLRPSLDRPAIEIREPVAEIQPHNPAGDNMNGSAQM